MGDKVFKLLGTAFAVGAGLAAKKAAEKSWKVVMHTDPPANPEDPETAMWEAVAWAVGSGAFVALARLLIARKWTQYFIASTGRAPANPNDVS